MIAQEEEQVRHSRVLVYGQISQEMTPIPNGKERKKNATWTKIDTFFLFSLL